MARSATTVAQTGDDSGGEAVPVYGNRDFQGQRLNVLQIGLGTYGTFLQNLAYPDHAHMSIAWLLKAVSDQSNSLLGVGVEPVPEHIGTLRPCLEDLPNTSLVQAAVTTEIQSVEIYTVTSEEFTDTLTRVSVTQQQEFMRQVPGEGESVP